MRKPIPTGVLDTAILAARVAGLFFPNKKAQLALSVGKQLARTTLRAQKLQQAEAKKAINAQIRAVAKAKGLKMKDVKALVENEERRSRGKEV
jgi:hypothetical protein